MFRTLPVTTGAFALCGALAMSAQAAEVQFGTTGKSDATSIVSYIGMDKKLFQANGITLNWIAAGSAARAVQQTLAGSLDISIAATDQTVRATAQGGAIAIVAGAVGALLEQRARVADVLGAEEGGQPAVGDLARELRVLGPDRGDVDRHPVLHGSDHQLEGLARAVGQRQLVDLTVVDDPLATERHAQDLDVLARAAQLAGERLAVPALGDLGPGRPDPKQHPPAGDLVESRRGHRRHARRAARDLEDRRPDLDRPFGHSGQGRDWHKSSPGPEGGRRASG